MKKIFNFVIVLGILLLIFQFGVTFFKKEHKLDYYISINSKDATVHEEYSKTKDNDYYFFKVKYDDKEFVFDIDNIFNKQKKVINDIKVYEKDELTCISPSYIKEFKSDIICDVNGEQRSYASIKDKYNLDEFINTLYKFDKNKYVSSSKSSVISMMDVYKENFEDNENVIVYTYKRLVKLNRPSSSRIAFSNYDVYHNDLGTLIGKYYMLPKYEKKPEYSAFLIINMEDESIDNLYFDENISTNLYVNGVVDNKLYIFDKSNLVQYEINPFKKSYRIVGDKNTNGQYYDGEEWSTKNIYEFSNTEIKFAKKYSIKDNYVEAFESDKYYYYRNSNNDFYKVYKKDLTKRIFLFHNANAKEIQVVNDNIYYIDGTSLYRYNDTGTKIILSSKEFQYNYNNIYSVYFK